MTNRLKHQIQILSFDVYDNLYYPVICSLGHSLSSLSGIQLHNMMQVSILSIVNPQFEGTGLEIPREV